ncbi:hypothetical protein TNCT_12551 [Trichonephila clavata]|uniref:Uncharacterized protein n=1 Tax=Trichonephila clavata TaxID=2740835 RepID=A0A8X6HSJ3_TRICU|nr:hypothetical protein TNCT_12551 [Trichonephila clavata]
MREFELQKIRLQNETQRVVGSQPLPSGPKRYVKACETLSVGRQVSPKKPERLPKRNIRMKSQMRDPLSNVMAVGNQG